MRTSLFSGAQFQQLAVKRIPFGTAAEAIPPLVWHIANKISNTKWLTEEQIRSTLLVSGGYETVTLDALRAAESAGFIESKPQTIGTVRKKPTGVTLWRLTDKGRACRQGH